MKKLILLVLLCVPGLAMAQNNWTPGSYWQVSSIDTKPGMFDAYMENLDGLWRKQMDTLIEDGKVKSYRLFSNIDARHDEPDLYLLVEWTSAADMLDTPEDYWDDMTEKLTGSIEASRERAIAREDIRTLMGSMLLREVHFE